jgi:hypothetical protein
MELVRGYFTVERNILGATLGELEEKLGFRQGRLTAQGARVLVLLRQPAPGEFVVGGSTRYSDGEGLIPRTERRSVAIPHAWRNQRLVKVVPNLPHTHLERYPSAASPVEQWDLLVHVPADLVCELTGQRAYWGR